MNGKGKYSTSRGEGSTAGMGKVSDEEQVKDFNQPPRTPPLRPRWDGDMVKDQPPHPSDIGAVGTEKG